MRQTMSKSLEGQLGRRKAPGLLLSCAPAVTLLVCGLVVTVSVLVFSWLLQRFHTQGARAFCMLWSQRLAEQLAALPPRPRLAGAVRALHIQAERHSYLLDDIDSRPRALALLRKQIRQTCADTTALAHGHDPFRERPGVTLRAHHSPIDGTLQPYSVSVPERYTPSMALPLLLHLHGHGWYRPFQGHPAPLIPGAIVLSPHARGSTDYMYTGEADALVAIDDVRRQYRIDDRRVYAVGASMGGTGAWNLAVRHPDLFAAIGPINGNADHHVWESLWGWHKRTTGPLARLRRFLADGLSPITFAENLLNVPVFCIHAEADEVVPVQHARNMVESVKASGGNVIYSEIPEAGHGDTPSALRTSQLIWLGQQIRNPSPKRVRYKTNRRRYAGAYWVRVLDLRRELDFASVDARVVEPGKIEVETHNVRALALQLSQAPTGAAVTVTVKIDSTATFECEPGADAPECFSFDDVERKWLPGQGQVGGKTAAVEGPIEHVFMTPFILVYGTQTEDRLEAATIENEAKAFARQWERRYGKSCRIKPDSELTEQEAQLLSLVLYGGPWANSWTARLIGQMPVSITQEAITFDGQEHAGPDVGVKLCFPSPLNPSRYVALFAATTWRGMYQINNRFGNWFDWGVYDNRNWCDFAVYDSRTWSPETFRAVGFFNRNWETAADLTWPGIPKLRETQLPFVVPATDRPAGDTVYLSDFRPSLIEQGKGPVTCDRTWEGGSIWIGEQRHDKGLGVKAPSTVEFALGGKYRHFAATVGIDYASDAPLSSARMDAEIIEFEVYGDEKHLASSGPISIWRPANRLTADMTDVETLSLRVTSWTGARWLLGSAVWADAKVTVTAGEPPSGDGEQEPGSTTWFDELMRDP